MKSFFDKIKVEIDEHQEIAFKLKYKTFTDNELNSWINNDDWEVRYEVASQGYALHTLINDKDWWVREVAENQLKKHKL